MPLQYDRSLIPKARELRHNETREEKRLWYGHLRKHSGNFQRQKSIRHYIVDFYSYPAKLVIELDGSQHHTEEGIESDANRTAALEEYGLEVIRFDNSEIWKHWKEVCEIIDQKVEERREK